MVGSITKERRLQFLEMHAHLRFAREVPQSGLLLAQRQHGRRPGLAPPGFDGPRSPPRIGRAGPVFPAAVIEGAEPRATQPRVARRLDLNTAEEFRQLILDRKS